MGGTFHLNSGLFGEPGHTVRIGNLGLDAPKGVDPHKRHLLPHVSHSRLQQEEARHLYKDFEVASHTVSHQQLLLASSATLTHQITDDAKSLRDTFGQPVTGFAFPFGMGGRKCRAVLLQSGIEHARTALTTNSFAFPSDPYALRLTAMCLSRDAVAKVQRFINATSTDGDLFFLLFAHGYELDFGTRESNWQKFGKTCDMVSSHDDITCCSIADAFRIHRGEAPLTFPFNQ